MPGQKTGLSVLFTVCFLLSLASGFYVMSVFSAVIFFSFFIAYIWNKLSLRGLKIGIERQDDRGQVGDIAKQIIWIENDSLLPRPWLHIVSLGSLPKIKPLLVGLWARSGRNWFTLEVLLESRGRFDWGDLGFFSSDPFALFDSQLIHRNTGKIIIYPRAVELEQFSLSNVDFPSDAFDYKETMNTSPNVISIRQYNASDSIGRIHWPSTAKFNRLMTKEFENEIEHEVSVIVDLDKRAHSGSGIGGTEEMAIMVAASVSRYFIEKGSSVGFIGLSDSEKVLAPRSGDRQLLSIFNELALIRAVGKYPIEHVLTAGIGKPNQQAALIIVTPSKNGALSAIKYLEYRNAPGAVIYIDYNTLAEQPFDEKEELNSNRIPLYIVNEDADLNVALNISSSLKAPMPPFRMND